MKVYYYEVTGQQAGPVNGDELRAHGVRATTLVWCEGMTQWAPAASLAELTHFFQPVPPPLPRRSGPPPLPSAVIAPPNDIKGIPVASPLLSTPISVFNANAYSIPQLGVFKGHTAVYASDSGKSVAVFAENADLDRLYKDGLWFNEAYRFVLLDETGKVLLTFYKPAKSIVQSLKHELHILDAQNQLLGICRNQALSFANPFDKQNAIITVTDAYSQTLLELDSMKGLQATLTVELVQHGRAVGSIVGSRGTLGDDRPPFSYGRDRFELRFNPEVGEATKAIGLGAVLALHLFVRHKWR